MTSGPPLETRDLSFRFTEERLLEHIGFSIREGSFTALLGPNGAGKTTLFRLILGDLKPTSGSVLLSGRESGSIPVGELPGLISFVPQATAPVFPLTVRDIVLLGLQRGGSVLGGPSSEHLDRAQNAIAHVGLLGMEQRVFQTLSGGEKQLAALARALAQDTPLMLLDEPTAALDLGHESRVAGILRKLNRERGATILMSTHSIPLAASLADRIVLLAEGTIIAGGKPEDVITTETIRRAYGMDAEIERDSEGRLTVRAGGLDER
jgi:iron complex transport system ATP-binding protein